MGVVAAFDYAKWVARYPEFASVDQALVGELFNEATIYHANDGSGPVNNVEIQRQLLGMIVAHLVKTGVTVNGQAPSGLVGRISAATEGSVSVSVDNPYPPGSAQWFQQTPYGSNYLAATRGYRLGGRYRANPGRFFLG